jgi:Luciferase-like monooxygenase
MRYGFVAPGGDAAAVAGLAREAEAAGWDGLFYPDGMAFAEPMPWYDPWVVLAAVAVATSRITIGPMLTPVSRRRPWKLARETVTLDHLSHGRLTLPVGLGAVDTFGPFGEATDRKTRAELLDEGLDVLTGLWAGEPFRYEGKHYRVGPVTFLPKPVQQPRIPIWVVGAWPSERSMRRPLRYDGLLPNKLGADGTSGDLTPDDVRAMAVYVAEHRTAEGPFEIVVEGTTPGDDPGAATATVREWAEAGATWWLEAMWTAPNGPEELLARIRQGPPRLE